MSKFECGVMMLSFLVRRMLVVSVKQVQFSGQGRLIGGDMEYRPQAGKYLVATSCSIFVSLPRHFVINVRPPVGSVIWSK